MYSLVLVRGAWSVQLSSAQRAAVVKSAEGDGAEVTQEIEFSLEGSASWIGGTLYTLGRLLALAEVDGGLPGAEYVYLEARLKAGAELWRSRVVGGSYALLGAGAAQRTDGAQGVRLTVRRLNYWEGEAAAVQLTARSGTSTGGVGIDNHADAAHGNWTRTAIVANMGELRAPVELEFAGADLDANGILYCGGMTKRGNGNLPVLEFEAGTAGAGATGTVTAAPSASNGNFWRGSWSGDTELSLWKSSVLSASWFNEFCGRPFMPIVRLHNPVATDPLYLRWRVKVVYGAGESSIHDGAGVHLLNGRLLSPCAPIFIPPWPIDPGETAPSIAVELRATGAAGAHAMDLDCVTFVPLESWRVYRPLVEIGGGLRLWDDPVRERVRRLDASIQAHAAEGPGLWLEPMQEHIFCFLWEKAAGAAGAAWGAGSTATVTMRMRPRKRVL